MANEHSRFGRRGDARGPGDEIGVRIDTLRSIEANKVVDPGFSVVAQIVRKGLNRSLDELAEEVLGQ